MIIKLESLVYKLHIKAKFHRVRHLLKALSVI